MSSIALGMQVNELERRIEKLEDKLAALDYLGDTAMRLAKLEAHNSELDAAARNGSEVEGRVVELEALVAMMRHAIDVAVLPAQGRTVAESSAVIAEVFREDPFLLNDSPIAPVAHRLPHWEPPAPDVVAPVKPARVKATRA